MENQVPEEIKTERSAQLLALAARMSREYMDSMQGQQKEVLFEELISVDGREFYTGYTKEYIKVAVSCEEDLVNQARQVVLGEKLSDELYRCYL